MRTLLDVYESRPDLQKAFPEQGRGLDDWWNTAGKREYPNINLGTKDIQNLKSEEGDVGTWMDANRASSGQVSSNTPLTRFNHELIKMLKDYQGMGTAKYQEAASQGRTAQADAIMKESTPGMAPHLQSAIRSGEVGAMQPQVSGAEKMGQTFGEQLRSFGDVLTRSQSIAQSIETSQRQSQQDERNLISEAFESFGATAFDDLDPKDIAALEKTAGYSSGFISQLAKALKTKEVKVDEETDANIGKTVKIGDDTYMWNPNTQNYDTKLGGAGQLSEEDTANIAVLQDKISIFDSILGFADTDLDKITGTGYGATAGFYTHSAYGATQDMIAKVQQIISKETIDTLIDLKARGGTLGALSNEERVMLSSAATKIGTAAVTGWNSDKVIGYQLSKKEFIKEINTLKRIANRKITTMQGDTSSSDIWKDEDGFNWDFSFSGSGDTYSYKEGSEGGQCGSYVRKITGLRVGDSFQSKMSKMDSSIKYPQSGMIFTMPYKNTGHIGIIKSIKDGIATVIDSNWDLNERVKTHKIAVSKMTGFCRV